SVNSSSGSWYKQSISTSRGGTPFIILDKEQWAIAKTEWQSVPLEDPRLTKSSQNDQNSGGDQTTVNVHLESLLELAPSYGERTTSKYFIWQTQIEHSK